MSSSPTNPLKRLWFRWKSLKLPWRRRRLAGSDLTGNTFWEFKDALSANRLRRIVNYNPRAHYSDILITPQWHQWLRHTRTDPPSLAEQNADITRQLQLKQLARLADERWASKPSFLDDPRKLAQAGPATLPRDRGGYQGQTEEERKDVVRNVIGGAGEVVGGLEEKGAGKVGRAGVRADSPWKKSGGQNPGAEWQPDAWTPRMPVKK